MSSVFYAEKLNEINLLIENEEYEKAFLMLKEELDMPYVPIDLEIKFKELMTKCKLEIDDFATRRRNKPTVWNNEEIERVLNTFKDSNIELMAIRALKDFNSRNILETLQKYLNNETKDDINKTFLLLLLSEQNIDKELIVKKRFGEFKINPISINLSESKKSLKEIDYILNKILYNDSPSLYDISKFLLESYFYAMFPIFITDDISINDIAAGIIFKSNKMMNIDIEWSELEENLIFDLDNAKKIVLDIELNQIV